MSLPEQREEEAKGGRAAAEPEPEEGAERKRGGKREQAPSMVSAEAARGEPGCPQGCAAPVRGGRCLVQLWQDSSAARMAHLQCHLGYRLEKRIRVWVIA